jgi:predicted urease superfamily metal-dependent hydrolase
MKESQYIEGHVREGKVVPVTSVGRKIAYMWAEDAERQGIIPVETK